MTADTFDVVVLGAGPAGETAAGRLADNGLSVVIVEPELIGGECSYWGCIPSKTLIRPGDVLAAMMDQMGIRGRQLDAKFSSFLQKELLADQYVNLDQAGHSPEDQIPMARVFVDLCATDQPTNEAVEEKIEVPDFS